MKKQIFISTLQRIKIIFSCIKLTREYYKFSKQKNYHGLLEFFHSLSDQFVFTWEQSHIEPGTFFAMNVKLSTADAENKSMVVIFYDDDTVTIKPDLNCDLQTDPFNGSLEDAFAMLTKLVCMYMHPELEENEVYLGGIFKGLPFVAEEKYKTIRFGEDSLDSDGNKINDMRPVFISPEEHDLFLNEIIEEEKMFENVLNELFNF